MVEGGHFANVKPILHCDAKLFALGTGVGLDPKRHIFVLPIPTCWYLKTQKICITPNADFKIHPMQNPNASQWNTGCVGFQTQNSCVGHVFCVDFICFWWSTQTQFPVEYGLNNIAKSNFKRQKAIFLLTSLSILIASIIMTQVISCEGLDNKIANIFLTSDIISISKSLGADTI